MATIGIDPTQSNDAIQALRRDVSSGEFHTFLGAGVAMATAPKAARGWEDMILEAAEFACQEGCFSRLKVDAMRMTLEAYREDPTGRDMLLEFGRLEKAMGRPMGEAWCRWLSTFGDLEPENPELVDALLDLGGLMFTTNWDDLVEKISRARGVQLPRAVLRAQAGDRGVLDLVQKGGRGIVYLHGSWREPGSIVCSDATYEEARHDDYRRFIQSFLTSRPTIYVGCGLTLDDPNVSTIRRFLSEYSQALAVGHYRLVCDAEPIGAIRNAHADEPITVIRYGATYSDLPKFLRSLAGQSQINVITGVPKRLTQSQARSLIKAYLQSAIGGWDELNLPARPFEDVIHTTEAQKLFIERTLVVRSSPGVDTAASWGERRQADGPSGVEVTLTEALGRGQHLRIQGDAGAGKTALSRHLAWKAAQPWLTTDGAGGISPTKWLPVLIPGEMLQAGDADNLRALILASVRIAQGDRPANSNTVDAILSGEDSFQVLVVLDAFDEVGPPDLQRQLGTVLAQLTRPGDEAGVRVVLSTRAAGLEQDLHVLGTHFERVELKPFGIEEQNDFATRCLALMPMDVRARAMDRMHRYRTAAGISELASQPLGLVLLLLHCASDEAQSADDVLQLPALFDWLIHDLLRRRPGGTSRLADRGIGALRRMAWEMHNRRREALPHTDLAEIADNLGGAWLAEAFINANLLLPGSLTREGGVVQQTYGFWVKQLREFLTAGELVFGQARSAPIVQITALLEGAEVGVNRVAAGEGFYDEPMITGRVINVLSMTIAQLPPEDIGAILSAWMAVTDIPPARRRAFVQLALRAFSELPQVDPDILGSVARSVLEVSHEVDAQTFVPKTELERALTGITAQHEISDSLLNAFAVAALGSADECDWITLVRWIGFVGAQQLGWLIDLTDDEAVHQTVKELHCTSNVAQLVAIVRVLDSAFSRLSSPPASEAMMALGRMLQVLASGRGVLALASAWALMWIVKGKDFSASADPKWRPLAEVIAQDLTIMRYPPGQMGRLALFVSKVLCTAEDFWVDPLLDFAKAADAVDRGLAPTRQQSDAQLLDFVVALESRLRSAESEDGSFGYLARAAARLGANGEVVSRELETALRNPFMPQEDAREIICLLALSRTDAAEQALVRVWRSELPEDRRTDALLPLIITGSWRVMLDLAEHRAELDDLSSRTLDAVMAKYGPPEAMA